MCPTALAQRGRNTQPRCGDIEVTMVIYAHAALDERRADEPIAPTRWIPRPSAVVVTDFAIAPISSS
ncbi:hypothetical protein GCM10023195_86190 [Actinoallomurus liliacearum]|uniref:Uncharacterized protein n=1 Tax=Actinoallomurus liliacearum TaxID=1080073 RepID=A0ABP8U1W9_9ACTN